MLDYILSQVDAWATRHFYASMRIMVRVISYILNTLYISGMLGNHASLICSLTHWGRVTHIWVINFTIIVSGNGLSPRRRQSIIITSVGILLIRNFIANVSEILSEIHTSMFLKMSSAKWRQFGPGFNVLILHERQTWKQGWCATMRR